MTVAITAYVAPSAKFVVLRFRDGGGADTVLQSIATAPVVTSGGSPVTLGTPIWGPNDGGSGPGSGGPQYFPWVAYPVVGGPLSHPESTLISAAAGNFTTAAGTSPALASAVCANLLGGTLLPAFDATATKTLRQGWNMGPPALDTDAFPVKCNAASRIQGWSGAATLTADGYPATFTGQGFATASIFNCPTNGVDGKGRPNCPLTGTWTVKYTTPTAGLDGSLSANGPGDTCTLASTTIVGPDTVRTYDITGGGVYNSPNVLYSTTIPGNHNLRIYRPGVPTDGSLVYDPAWLDVASGAACLRTVTAIDFGGGGSVGTFAGFRSASHLSDSMASPPVGGLISSIGPGTDTTGWFGAQVPILVTYPAPHGIDEGILVNVNIPGTFTTTLGNPITIYGQQWARVVSPTTILVAGQFSGQPNPVSFVLSQTYTTDGTWTAGAPPSPGISPADAVARANAVGSDLWICVPCGLNDAGCQELFALVATTLNRGLKFWCEYTNEAWNDRFASFSYCQNLSYSLGGIGSDEAYVIRMGQVQAFAATAFANAGRSADLVRVLGSQAAASGRTSSTLALAHTHGLPVDAVAVAPYIENGSFHGASEPTLIATWAGLDDDQRMDLAELYAQTGHWDDLVAPHRTAILASAYSSAKLVGYEGGPQGGPSIGATQVVLATDPKTVHCSLGWMKHPRAWGILLFWMQMFQDNGMSLMNFFQLTGRTEGYLDSLGSNWTAIPALGVVAGRGDGSDGLANNLTIGPSGLPWEDYRAGHMVSVYAGSLKYWRSLVAAPPPTLCNVHFTRAA